MSRSSSSSCSSEGRKGRKSKKSTKVHHSKKRRLESIEKKISQLTELVSHFLPTNPTLVNSDHESIVSDESVRLIDKYTFKTLVIGDKPSPFLHPVGSGHSTTKDNNNSVPKDPTNDCLEVSVLDEDNQKLLGDAAVLVNEKGTPIYPGVATFKAPGNRTVGGPLLNPALTKATNGFTKNRDEELCRIQANIGTVIAGLGYTLSTLLDDSKSIDKADIIANLSDSARFLCGTQYQISLLRRREVKANVKGSFNGRNQQRLPK
ncbi:unnamed protein product [Orchesella dallaii]|uniref:Uncharacterized protein n=1 Tax=Orchesella dallaii TaxID=48710 RepID=A0ABP1QPF3_9HEXA